MAEPSVLEYASPQQPIGLDFGLRVRLSVMMFLEYAIWGAWWSVLGKYMLVHGFGGLDQARAYATTAVASIISPLIFGQIADRWVPTQRLLALLHLAGAVVLFLVPRVDTFGPFYVLVLAWALLYMPTLSLTNALGFHHIPEPGRNFPGVRVFGTIGWMAVGFFVGWSLKESSSQPIVLAGSLSLVMGFYCLMLPHTPPKGKAGQVLPFVRALGLLKDPQFALFVVVSFLIATLLAVYFTYTGTYLGNPSLGLKSAADKMILGQFAEMLLLPLLPFFLRTIGMKATLLLGIAAWGVRYGIFALGQPTWLVVGSLVLHGICYDFFFVAAYIHTDNQASSEIRASAQALFNLVVMGFGMWLGNEIFGRLNEHLTSGGVTDWSRFWAYPAVGVIVPVAIFALFFKGRKAAQAA